MSILDLPFHRHAIRGAVTRLYDVTVAEAWMSLDDMSLPHRLLIRGGYLLIALFVAGMLFLELASRRYETVPPIAYPLYDLLLAGTYLFAWTFLLMGAVQSRRRILLPVLSIFFFVMLIYMITSESPFALYSVLSVVGLSLLVSLVPALKAFTLRTPLFYFGALFVVMCLNTVLLDVGSANAGQWFMNIVIDFVLIFVFQIAGLSLIDFGTRIARRIVETLAGWFAPSLLMALVIAVLFGRWVVSYWLVFVPTVLSNSLDSRVWEPIEAAFRLPLFVLSVEFLLIILCLVLLGVLGVFRRWNVLTALTVFSLSLLTPIVAFGIVLAADGIVISDLFGTAVEHSGFFPPLLLFTILLSISLLGAGTSFAARNGRLIPRSARLFLVLGFVLLTLNGVIGMSQYFLMGWEDSSHLPLSQQVNFPVGIVFYGIPYVLFLAFRRRERLIGNALARFPARSIVPVLDGIPPRRLAIGVTIAGVALVAGSILFDTLLTHLFGLT